MRHGFAAALVGVALIAHVPDVRAQPDRQTCSAASATLPPELARWSSRRPIAAAGKASDVRAATLEIGGAADATLRSTGDVRYVTPPERPGGSESHGGLFTFSVDRAGTYRVALGAGAWIDVVQDRTPITSSAHGHGPECSGIRKMVDFPLTPGRYLLQIAGSQQATLPLMIVRLP